ncbi:protein ECERIFERUM 2-like [Gastrolobium bilobum]|uniref:protein ECERIFERUM 2-like n=1 Tax=Gastrolobium bilobum TaxID=150636 RepID=UPI002AAFFC64|nr:protein ECERIFERUM 2-like [Gastrolobium bilobum]
MTQKPSGTNLSLLQLQVPVPNMEENPPPSFRISSVVPATPTPQGDKNGEYHLGYMDLLMKLHYIRAVYFFSTEAVQGLSIQELKNPMFTLLDPYAHLSGRIRLSESGSPFIKCNDAGVRIAESHCDKTLQEWVHQNGYSSVEDLVHDHVLGPEVSFSPLVFFKFTYFQCGGLCVGLSWSHMLGDAFSAFNFITMWTKTVAGHVPPKSLPMPNQRETEVLHNSVFENPISLKRTTTVGEHWLAANDTKVVTHSFYLSPKQLVHLVTATSSCNEIQITKTSSYFEILSALVWKYISDIREDSGPKIVTICTYDTDRREDEFPTNGLVLSIVEANVAAGSESDVSGLARLIAEKKMVENDAVKKLVEENEGKEDFIVYGANLTFVDLEKANFYGAKLNGQKPILANCALHGVGDQGVVLVLPAGEDNEDDINGRIITVSLSEKELDQLKYKLGEEWGIASYPF